MLALGARGRSGRLGALPGFVLFPARPELIVLLAFFGIRQDFVRLVDLFEFGFGLRVAGIDVRVAGQGGPGRAGGRAGDLYLVVTVLPDARFERRGDDLYTRVVAPLATLVLGGEVRVPTPDGRRLALTIPAGTQDGRVFRLRGQGMPHLAQPDRRGDLHAEVHARLPEQVSPRQRELLEEFVRAGGEAAVGGTV